VVIHDDCIRVAVAPDEADTPLPIDADAVVPGTIPTQRLQAVGWRDAQIVQGARIIQHTELTPGDLLDLWREPAITLAKPDPLGRPVAEAFYHGLDNSARRYGPQHPGHSEHVICLNKRWKFDYERPNEGEIPEQELTRRRRCKGHGMSVHGDAFDLLVKAERFLREHLPVAGRVDEYPDDAKARSDGGPTDSRGARGQGGDGRFG
jgi:hypothetical protein